MAISGSSNTLFKSESSKILMNYWQIAEKGIDIFYFCGIYPRRVNDCREVTQ